MRSTEAVVAWVITLFTLGYMLPWAVAATRGKTNSGGIAVLNLLTGWTFIGWIVALAMAASAHHTVANQSVVVQVSGHQTPPPGWYPHGSVLRYWNGYHWTDATAEPHRDHPEY